MSLGETGPIPFRQAEGVSRISIYYFFQPAQVYALSAGGVLMAGFSDVGSHRSSKRVLLRGRSYPLRAEVGASLPAPEKGGGATLTRGQLLCS